jgi:hypothetical protein
MYRSCAFCAAALGGDGADTGLGVGRRFAYDGWKSRAWVICQRCSRWNLTPFDSRIDTIESLERVAAAGKSVGASEHVTMIRAGSCDVVRIGKPRRPELATWRYGERIKARRREHLKIYVPVAAVTVGAAITIDVLAGGSMAAMLGQLPAAIDWATMSIVGNQKIRVTPPICDRCGKIMVLKSKHLAHARMTEATGTDLALLLSCPSCRMEGAMLSGPDAEQALRSGMTYVNLRRKRKVKKRAEAAAEYLERHGGPETYLRNTVRRERKLGQLGGEEALALEMAVDERAELLELERQWHEAEELADIADHLLESPDHPHG